MKKSLSLLDDHQLIKAYYALQKYNWPKALGTKPDNWDRLRNYCPYNANIFAKFFLYRKTKEDIIAPYLKEIEQEVGKRWLEQTKGRNLLIKDSYELFYPSQTEEYMKHVGEGTIFHELR